MKGLSNLLFDNNFKLSVLVLLTLLCTACGGGDPTAENQTVSVVSGESIEIALKATSAVGIKSWDISKQPSGGDLVGADDTWVYTPGDGTKTDEFTFTVTNVEGVTGDGVVSIIVTGDGDGGGGNASVEYSYDQSGLRISQTVDGVTTFFIYSGSQLIAEMDEAGNTLVEYIYLHGEQIAMANNTGESSEELYITHTDHLGTPEVMTNLSGEEVWRREQLPFGETVKIEGDVVQNMRFPGQRFHEETGLHYNYHRDYDPSFGRYMQSDPIGVDGGLNTLAYAGNNPVMMTDSSGLLIDAIADAGFIAYDLYRIAADNVFGDCDNFGGNAAALGADVAGLFTPGATGLGMVARAGSHAGDGAKVTKSADNVIHLPHTDKFGNIISRNPRSIQDKMTLDAAKQGQGIVKVPSLSDPKYKGMQKMELETISAGGKKSNVHYVRDADGNTMDFKFKKHSTDYINKYEKN